MLALLACGYELNQCFECQCFGFFMYKREIVYACKYYFHMNDGHELAFCSL
jgi:hypothetical protein